MIKCEAARPTVRKRAISILIIAAFVIGFFGAAALALYLPDRKIKTHSPTEEFAAFLDSRAPKLMGLYGIPGVSIALVRDGQIVYSAAYGEANQKTGLKMTVDMPMRVQSISKSVTAWAVLKLVEEGKLNLDEPVETYLKGWKLPASDYPPDGVTVKRLLCHTAGMPLGDVFALYSPDETMPSLKVSLTRTAILFQSPGKGFSYSNVGYNLLELVIEEVTGRDFAEYMKNEILYPLGIYHSDFEWSEKTLASAPLGYTLNGKSVPPYRYPERASGGLIATAEDIALFCIAGMPDFSDQRVLTRPSIEHLYLGQAEGLGIYSAVFDSYGFGYYTEELSGELAVSHGGQGTGWMSHFHAVPETGDAIVILTNSQRSWPFISSLLKGWARWRGFSPPGMTIILLGECLLWGLVGLIISITLCLIANIVRKIMKGDLRTNSMQRIAGKPSRIIKIGISLSIFAVLLWALCQKYLFLTSVFPVSSIWLGVCAAAFSLALLIESLCYQ